MKKSGIIFTLAIISAIIVAVFIFKTTNAYNDATTHPLLTQEIAEVYNAIYDPDLTEDEIQSLIAGSTDEDTAPRWINHFYDPTTGLGWSGERFGNISSVSVLTAAISTFDNDPLPATVWVQDQESQNSKYSLYQGDRTFNSAVLYSLEGKNQEAYYSLGYVLHLVEDMAVPAHTRQDTHVDLSFFNFLTSIFGANLDEGEPYEEWAKENGRIGQETMDYLKKNYQLICDSLDNCLIYLAKYSNNNFFSEDSISDGRYRFPQGVTYEDFGGWRTYFSSDGAMLARAMVNRNNRIAEGFSLDYDEIHQAYWDRLSPAAILAGVEVVRYFHDQVEKAERKEIVLERPKKLGFFDKIKTLSPYGEATRVVRYLASVFINPFTGQRYGYQDNGGQYKSQSLDLLTDLEITPENAQERMDDLQELIDLLNGSKEDVNPFALPSFSPPISLAVDAPSLDFPQLDFEIEAPSLELPSIEMPIDLAQQSSPNNPGGVVYGNGGGGGSSISYPKILISEVQILPIAQRFVELFNPNNEEVSLTGWYIQRKTSGSSSWSSFVSSTNLEGKKIPAKGYLLISRETLGSDILLDITLSENNSLALKNPNREVSDVLGFGQATDYEGTGALNPASGKAIGRKWINGTEKDTDNNYGDFEEQTRTPKSQNISPTDDVPLPEPEPVDPLTDTKAPTVLFSLPTEQQNLIFDVLFNITDLSTENVSPSGLQAFQFRWRDGEDGEWQEDVSANIGGVPVNYDAVRNFSGSDENGYHFQVKAKDMDNNESEWLPEEPAFTLVRTPKTIVINEIQIDGVDGEGGTEDDWVELYNPYDIDVSLQGWSIQKHSKSDPCGISSSFYKKNFGDDEVIPAKGFYLIVDTQAGDSLLNIADMTIGWSLASDSTVYLVRNQEAIESGDDSDIIDKVGFGEACFAEGSATVNPPEGKSIERKVIGVDTDNNLADFRVSAEITPKVNSTASIIQDITNYPICGGSGSPGTLRYYLKIKWGSASSVDFYQVQYNKNDNGWQDWIARTSETEKIYEFPLNYLLDRNIISFRVRTQDTDGNLGDWAEINIDLSNSILINELALWGTDADPSTWGQWIELYNKGDSPVDLTGWKLVSGDSGTKLLDLTLEGTIEAKGYFVLERAGDQTISDVVADQVYTGGVMTSGSFNLFAPNGRRVDSMPIFGSDSIEDSYMKEDHHYSKERVSHYEFGLDPENWEFNDGLTLNGQDSKGNQIYGTPGRENSVNQLYTPIYLDIVEDTVLPKSLSPYHFHGGDIYVLEGATLAIEPGVKIKFHYDSGINVLGTLKAIGSEDEPIIFTSLTEELLPGYWLGIKFGETSKDSELERIKLSFAGKIHGDFSGDGIVVNKSSISLKNSTISINYRRGLKLINSSSTIDGLTASDNARDDSQGVGIYIEGGSPTIINSSLIRNHFGIYKANHYLTDGSAIIPATPYLENIYYEDNPGGNIWPTTVSEP